MEAEDGAPAVAGVVRRRAEWGGGGGGGAAGAEETKEAPWIGVMDTWGPAADSEEEEDAAYWADPTRRLTAYVGEGGGAESEAAVALQQLLAGLEAARIAYPRDTILACWQKGIAAAALRRLDAGSDRLRDLATIAGRHWHVIASDARDTLQAAELGLLDAARILAPVLGGPLPAHPLPRAEASIVDAMLTDSVLAAHVLTSAVLRWRAEMPEQWTGWGIDALWAAIPVMHTLIKQVSYELQHAASLEAIVFRPPLPATPPT